MSDKKPNNARIVVVALPIVDDEGDRGSICAEICGEVYEDPAHADVRFENAEEIAAKDNEQGGVEISEIKEKWTLLG